MRRPELEYRYGDADWRILPRKPRPATVSDFDYKVRMWTALLAGHTWTHEGWQLRLAR